MEVSTVNVSSTSKSNSNSSNLNINSSNNNNTTSLNHNNEDNLQSNHLIINSKMSVSNSTNNFSNNINNGNNQTHIDSSTATKNKIINHVQHFPNIHSIEQIPREDLKLDETELDVSVIINRILNKVEGENLLKVTTDNNNASPPEELPLQNVNAATSMQEQSSYRDNDSGLDSTQLDQNSLDLSPDDGSCDLVIDSNLPSDDMQESINQTDQHQQQQQQHLNEKFPIEDQESEDPDKIAPDTVNTITTTENIAAPNTIQVAPKQDSGFKDITKVETLISPHLQNDNAPKLISITDRHLEEQKQINPEADSEAIKENPPLEGAQLKDSLKEVAKLDGIVSEITKVDDLTDVQEDKAKDMVTLKNLEISPPPLAEGTEKNNEEKTEGETELGKVSTKGQPKKRKRNDNSGSAPERCESTESGSRTKRQRTQTKLFQAGDAKSYEEPTLLSSSTKTKPSTRPAARNRKKSTTSSNSDANLTAQDNIIQDTTTDLQDVIFYEKNDYLAIRNEEDSFFLCQLAETVRVKRPLLRVKWLDTKNGGQTYFLTSHYDKVPRKSIIVPVSLNKLKSEKKGEQTFTLSDHDRLNIEERLKRSLNAQTELGSSQESGADI